MNNSDLAWNLSLNYKTAPHGPHAEAPRPRKRVGTPALRPQKPVGTPARRTGTALERATAFPAAGASAPTVGKWLQFAFSSPGASGGEGAPGGPAPGGHEAAALMPVLKRVDTNSWDAEPESGPGVPIRLDRLSAEMSRLYAALEGQVPAWIESGWESSEGAAAGSYALGVTSAVAGEGKTTVALHLALHVARSTLNKVCLIDLSLGDDELSRLLGVPAPPLGLMNLLEQRQQTVPALQLSGDGGPVIMLAGRAPANPARVARSRRVCELIGAARQMFDMVLVELPAVLTGNALPLTLQMDGLVMVTRAGATPDHVVHRAVGQIGQTKLLGVVLNGVKSSSPKWVQRRLLGR